jgi:hypothetical protein
MNWELIWLAVLTVVLIAHMIKDAMEFKKIKKLEEEIDQLKKG